METAHGTTRNAQGNLPGLPFGGLGFDLRATAARSGLLALVPLAMLRRGSAGCGGPHARLRRPGGQPMEWRPYGRGLLLRLCRETAGR